MLLGSDLAAALSSSSRGTSPGDASPFPGGASPMPDRRRLRLRQNSCPQRSPLPQHRSNASIFRPTNDCRHFHYETVELGPVQVKLLDEAGEEDIGLLEPMDFTVESNGNQWQIRRTFADLCQLDQQLHRCIFSREHSRLKELCPEGKFSSAQVRDYMQRLSLLTGSLIRCYPVLSFFELDNRGNHFHPAEFSQINRPAIACAVVIRPFTAQPNSGQLELRVGDIVSVVEMSEGEEEGKEAPLWRGKLTVPSGNQDSKEEAENRKCKVGSFPASCVRLFSDRLSLGEQIWLAQQPKPGALRRRHSTAQRILMASPTPRLKSLIRLALPLSPRAGGGGGGVFGRELTAFGSKGPPPLVSQCVAVIEREGLVPGIYRQCGVQSNIRRLRREFDSAARCPQWNSPQLAQLLSNDIHSVPSLLKQFFRQLPDPLLCFQLHHPLIEAFSGVRNRTDSEQLAKVQTLVEDLPPAHYQTARCLFRHLQRISRQPQTEMSARSLAIVWAPNLLRCPPAQMAEWPNQLAGLDLHTDICAFLISFADALFGAEEAGPAETVVKAMPEVKIRQASASPSEEDKKMLSLPPSPLPAKNGWPKRERASHPSAALTTNVETAIELLPVGNGTAAVHSVIEITKPATNGKLEKSKRRATTTAATSSATTPSSGGQAKWRRMLQSGAQTVTAGLLGGRTREEGNAKQKQSLFGQRSLSVDRPPSAGGKERRAQRLLSPLGASVMRRVRSVRDSVKKLRPGPSVTAPTSSAASTSPMVVSSVASIGGGVPFADDSRPGSSACHPTDIGFSSGAETVKEATTAERHVNFDGPSENGTDIRAEEEKEEEGEKSTNGLLLAVVADGAESVDSMPLDISRYDNVHSLVLLATGGGGQQTNVPHTKVGLGSPPTATDVALVKARLKPLSLQDEEEDGEQNREEQGLEGSGETIYF